MKRQEAMTSKQIMLIVSLVWLFVAAPTLVGCKSTERADTLLSPYPQRQVFAVVPLRNESGSSYADGVRMADKVAQQLALTRGLDVLPVNRVLGAMNALGYRNITDLGQAMALKETLGVDGLVVGSVTAYEPYEPMKLGLTLELYADPYAGRGNSLDTRQLSRSATDPTATLPRGGSRANQPASVIAAFYDAADPNTTDLLDAFAMERGPDGTSEMTRRRYRISMDLYSEFVSYQLAARLIDAERLRLKRPGRHNTANTRAQANAASSPRAGY